MKKIFAIIIATLTLTSCEKEINIDLNSVAPQIVIEGTITNEPGPYFVKITKTVNFSEGNDYPPVLGAMVIISDNTNVTDTLTEITPGNYQTNSIIGKPGNTYKLTVRIEDKSYFATSTMPLIVNLDSLSFIPFSTPNSNSGFSTVPAFTDPPSLGNNYRFIQTVNGVIDNSYIIVNDFAMNGVPNQRPILSPNVEINTGDSVKVEMRCIDLSTYTYFYTLSQIAGGGPGGGTTPTNPPNNIKGDYALGLFSAYTTQKRTQVVK